MKDKYDFTGAEQGRFYTRPEDMHTPHYLEPELEIALRQVARTMGLEPDQVLGIIVAKDLEFLKAISRIKV